MIVFKEVINTYVFIHSGQPITTVAIALQMRRYCLFSECVKNKIKNLKR